MLSMEIGSDIISIKLYHTRPAFTHTVLDITQSDLLFTKDILAGYDEAYI